MTAEGRGGMKRGGRVTVGLVALVLAAAGGYWLGQTRSRPGDSVAGAAGASAPTQDAKPERKLLYYRNPMGLPDTSPVPKKDPMGMDYIPVYSGEEDTESAAANHIRVSTEKVQKLGVRTEVARRVNLDRIVRTAGRVEPDERRLYAIAPKFEGFVERLHVNVTGQPVAKGQPLFEVYSPELVSAQREYAIAAQGVRELQAAPDSVQSAMQQLADASLLRLKNWDISEEQIKTLANSREAKRTLTFHSPVSGIVIEKKALQGMRFMPGEMLFQVADLSSVWVVADVFEQDIGFVHPGAKAMVRVDAYPGKVFAGRISYVYPTLKPETRTIPVRIELANPGQLLKPAMFAQVELALAAKAALAVPVSAVIDSGTRRLVFVAVREGRFEPREVLLGSRSDDYVEVLDGVQDGEQVVVAANFLIDAESNLKAAVGGFGHSGHVDTTILEGAVAATVVGHRAEGIVESVDAKAGAVRLSHGPVASLNWPAMTMNFKIANESMLKELKPGVKVAFEFVERGQGEWVLTAVHAVGHAGH